MAGFLMQYYTNPLYISTNRMKTNKANNQKTDNLNVNNSLILPKLIIHIKCISISNSPLMG